MAIIERDVVLQGVEENGTPTIDLPVTRLGNIEDTAEVKAAPETGDYIPVIDSADGGQMKKTPWSGAWGGAGGTPSDDVPRMDGEGSAGTGTAYARGDHVHPTDTSRLAEDGDGSRVTVCFNADTAGAPASGETLAVLLGKLARIAAGLGELAGKNGISLDELDASIRASLERADTALQSFTESDPTVPVWAKQPDKPVYTAAEVGAIPASEKDALALKTEIPGRTSQLENDSGFLTEHQDISGKLDKTATAAAATKLATARTIRTNLASTSTASFNGTASVTPGVTGVLPVANGGTGSSVEKYLPLAGGTLTGNLTLKGSGNYGTKINLGDGDYVHISEPTDDCMEIKAKKVDFVLSDTSSSRLTVNGSPLGGGGLTLVADFTLGASESKTVTVETSGVYLIAGSEAFGIGILCIRDMDDTGYYNFGLSYELSSSGSLRRYYNFSVRKTSDTTIRIRDECEDTRRVLVYKLN